MEWVASTLHTTSEHGVSSITTTDAHTSAANSRTELTPPSADLNGLVRFARKTRSGFCACAITFQTQSNTEGLPTESKKKTNKDRKCVTSGESVSLVTNSTDNILMYESESKFKLNILNTWCKTTSGHPVAQLVEALSYTPGGRGFDSRWCHWNFSLP